MALNPSESSQAVNKEDLHLAPKRINCNKDGFDIVSAEDTPEVSRINAKIELTEEIHKESTVTNSRSSHLPNTYQVKPTYILGTFIKNVQFGGPNSAAYICQKTSRFPFSKFLLQENVQNGQVLQLKSNFSGTKYTLSSNQQIIMTILFTISCAVSSHRQFQIFAVKPGQTYSQLRASDTGQDLDKLYQISQNSTKIIRLINSQPQLLRQTGQLVLDFAQKSIIPSVKNAVILSEQGREILQMYKTNAKQQTFQICCSNSVPIVWSLAFSLASLDFKLALQ